MGNKLDLEDKREVSTEEAKAWADSFEVSAIIASLVFSFLYTGLGLAGL